MEKPSHMWHTNNPNLDIQAEFHSPNKALQILKNEFSDFPNCNNKPNSQKKIAQRLKDLGMERARRYGWEDTYVFTKAMGEMLIMNEREHLPVVIVRPSVIESTSIQPFPGWIEGNRMLDPIITQYGKGQLFHFLADGDTVLDLITRLSREQSKYMAKIYRPYAFYKTRFDISNLEKLFEELSEEEKENFKFDVKNIQWNDYLGNIHIPGLRQHVMKGRGTGNPIMKI